MRFVNIKLPSVGFEVLVKLGFAHVHHKDCKSAHQFL